MALEDLTGVDKFIDDLVNTNPAAGDNPREGDDHIRGVKNVLLNTFPNVDAAVTADATELNRIDGVTENIQPALDNANTALASVKALQYRLWPTIANNSTDADHDIDFSTGIVMDSVGDEPIDFTAMIKRIDANWVAGTNQGGFPSALTIAANTTYHCFVIKDTTNTLEDAGFDTSLTATNLLADATDYTKYRRIGSVITDGSSNIRVFTQVGHDFMYPSAIRDVNVSVLSSTTSRQLYTVTAPLGIKTRVYMRLHNSSNSAYLVQDPDEDGQVVSVTASPGATSSDSVANEISIYTDTSSQIAFRHDGTQTSNIDFMTYGYRDERIA